jgi:hypothetical protein
MGKRLRFKHTATFEERLAKEAERLREQARKLRDAKAREELLRKASLAETAARLNEWISSPGLQPPKLK